MLSTLEGYNDNLGFSLKKAAKRARKSVRKVTKKASPLKKLPYASAVMQIAKTASPMQVVEMAKNIQDQGIKQGLMTTATEQASNVMAMSDNPIVKIAAGIIPGGASVIEAVNQAQDAVEIAKEFKEVAYSDPDTQNKVAKTLNVVTPATIKATQNLNLSKEELLSFAATDAERNQISDLKDNFDAAVKAKMASLIQEKTQPTEQQKLQPVIMKTGEINMMPSIQSAKKNKTFLDYLKSLFSGSAEPINFEKYLEEITKGASKKTYTADSKPTATAKKVIPVSTPVVRTVEAPKQQPVINQSNNTPLIIAGVAIIGGFLLLKKKVRK